MASARNISDSTIKRLYAFSGNQCANPDCKNEIMESKGKATVGVMCHIEAASPKGARYNENMADKDRAAYDNLILLCRNCHAIIDNKDNLKTYTVETLKTWKTNHENINKNNELHISDELLNSTRSPEFYTIHPDILPEHFVGRKKPMDFLIENIWKEKDKTTPYRIIKLIGIGGIGKTSIVLNVFDKIKELPVPYSSVLWFSFDKANNDNVTSFLKEILRRIDVDYDTAIAERLNEEKEDGKSFMSNEFLVHRLCAIIQDHPILLFIDNLEKIQETSKEGSKIYGRFKKGAEVLTTLFEHVLNSNTSMIISTSRYALPEFIAKKYYKNLEIKSMTQEEGAALLSNFEIGSSEEERLNFSELLANHPLCITAASVYMKYRMLTPEEFIANDSFKALLEKHGEGEKLKEILDLYKSLLTQVQQHFLMMMSIHVRFVTKENFPILIRGYNKTKHSRPYIQDKIIDKLLDLKLISVTKPKDSEAQYASHPLMKFAYKSWFDDNLEYAYEYLAEYTEESLISPKSIFKSEETQAHFDVIHYHLEAKNYTKAFYLIVDNFNLFMKFKLYEETYDLLSVLEKAYRSQQFTIPFDSSKQHKLSFLNKLSYTSKDREKKVAYNLEAIDEAFKKKDIFSYNQLIALTVNDYLDAGYSKKAKTLLEKYEDPKDTIEYLAAKSKINFSMGDYEIGKQGFLMVYDNIARANDESSRDEQHNRTRTIQKLAPMLLVCEDFDRAEALLKKDLAFAKKHKFDCCVVSIYDDFIDLCLDKNQIDMAKALNQENEDYCKDRGIRFDKHIPLLNAIGAHDEVIDLCMKDISTDDDIKYDKKKEIEALVNLAIAYKAMLKQEQAIAYYNQALDMMDRYSYYPSKPKLEVAFKD